MITQQHTQVLIVGAGPSGLMMAAQLLRYGVQPIIIDSKQGPTNQSKALAVQARSLEIYRQMGIVDRALQDGKQAASLTFNDEGKPVAKLLLTDIGSQQTPFPFVLLYQQSKNERLLLDFLTQNCCPVYWNTTLTGLTQTEHQAKVQLQTDEKILTLNCDWVIGADGTHSAVRKQLSIPFIGDTYGNVYFLADIEISNLNVVGDLQFYLAKYGFTAFIPLPENNRYRIIGNLPKQDEEREDLQLEDILPHLNNVTRLQLNVADQYWFTTYRLHHRMADNFRKQRCFLIGDAAHIHSPVGGQGMNTGLQDAYNLGWKLAGVLNGQINEHILDSYAAERMPVAQKLLKTTDKAFKFIVSGNWAIALLRKWFMPRILQWAWGNSDLRSSFFKVLSQISISYRDSQINLHLSNSTKIKAGDRLPYFKVYDEKKQQETDLHEWCSKPGFTLIVLGNLKELDLFTLAKWITQNYGRLINFFYLPPSTRNREIFDAFEIKESQKKALIIRPDMHIGLLNDVVDIDMMDNYLKKIIGIKHNN